VPAALSSVATTAHEGKFLQEGGPHGPPVARATSARSATSPVECGSRLGILSAERAQLQGRQIDAVGSDWHRVGLTHPDLAVRRRAGGCGIAFGPICGGGAWSSTVT
jgi:hypothetical protein